MPVRMAIKEDIFNSAVLAHKERLISLIQSQVEVEQLKQVEGSVVAAVGHNEMAPVVSGFECDEIPQESHDQDCRVDQAISIENSEEESNATLPST